MTIKPTPLRRMSSRMFNHRATADSAVRTTLSVLAGACAALCATAVQAQQSPYSAALVQGVSTDSNVDRVERGAASDTVSSTGLRLGVDQTFGRQRLVLAGDVNVNRYLHRKVLNNTDFSLNSRLEWSTIERLSGVLVAGARQSLYRLGNSAGTPTNERNVLRNSNLGLQARLGVVTDLSFDAGVSASQDRYSVAAASGRNLIQKSGNVGVQVRPGSGLSLRVGLRHGDGRYADGSDVVKRDDVDLSSTLELSGASTVNVRLSRTLERHRLDSVADTRSWTGGLGWAWKPLGRLSFGLDLTRDGSVAASGFDGLQTTGASTDTRMQNHLGLRAGWEIGAAWHLNSALAVTRRTVDSRLVLGSTAAADVKDQYDRTVNYSVGLAYAPMRNLEFACNISREDRSVDTLAGSSAANAAANTATSAYAVSTFGCNAQIHLR
jgi:hypothetical protein